MIDDCRDSEIPQLRAPDIPARSVQIDSCSRRPATNSPVAATPLETSPPAPPAVLENVQTRRSARSLHPLSQRKLQSPGLSPAIDSSEQAPAVAQKFSPARATAPGTRRSAQSPNFPAKNIRSPADSRCAPPTARDSGIRTAPPHAPESPRSLACRPATSFSIDTRNSSGVL